MIGQNVKQILSELPEGIELVAAAKTGQPKEVLEAVAAGVKMVTCPHKGYHLLS